MKNRKTANLVWGISLMVVSVVTLLIIMFDFPDVIIRLLGIMEIVALPILVYATVIKIKNKF